MHTNKENSTTNQDNVTESHTTKTDENCDDICSQARSDRADPQIDSKEIPEALDDWKIGAKVVDEFAFYLIPATILVVLMVFLIAGVVWKQDLKWDDVIDSHGEPCPP